MLVTEKQIKQFYFKDPNITNIRVPQKIIFCIDTTGLNFDNEKDAVKDTIQVNCSSLRFSTRFCKKIWINTYGDLRAWTIRENKLAEDKGDIICTENNIQKIFLESITSVRICSGFTEMTNWF